MHDGTGRARSAHARVEGGSLHPERGPTTAPALCCANLDITQQNRARCLFLVSCPVSCNGLGWLGSLWATPGPSHFHTNFRTGVSVSAKELAMISVQTVESVRQFGNCCHLNRKSYS